MADTLFALCIPAFSSRVCSGTASCVYGVKALLPLLLFGLLSACNLAPDYKRPEAPIPTAYSPEQAPPAPEPLAWQHFFTDPRLQKVIDLALANNRDMRIALARIEEARAQYQVQQAALLPTITAVAAENVQRMPADISPTGRAGIHRQYSATLGFSSFELDLFGRIRNLREQAVETFLSVEQDAKTAQIMLITEIAGLYLQLAADKELLVLAKSTYENRQTQYKLIEQKANAGLASALALQQARASMEDARATFARAGTQVEKSNNRLALVMGTSPPADLALPETLTSTSPLPNTPEGLPSSLLERRPDIQAAEHRLKGANANIGAARANFFPTISLTGAFGSVTREYANLFTAGTGGWNFAPQAILPIFDLGRNIALLRSSEAQQNIAVAQYEKSVQIAFYEVKDALAQRTSMSELTSAATNLEDAATKAYSLANARYKNGVDSYLQALDAARTLYTAQQNTISTRLLREASALTLYKALGGGWDTPLPQKQ